LYQGYVSDFTDVLKPASRVIINSIAEQIEKKTGVQIAVVVISTTGQLSIEEYGVELFERWGIGQRNKDNGMLVLIALKDRKIRLEVGYGLEPILTDAICHQIIDGVFIPDFKKGETEKGIMSGTIAIAEIIAKGYNINLALDKRLNNGFREDAKASNRQALVVFLVVFLFIHILSRHSSGKRRRRGGYFWYGGSYYGGRGGFGGGFGGFGGGISGGGGATGRW
jgi:uncharacterized protein